MSNEEDRASLDIAVMTVLTNVMNFPEKVQARLLGQDMRPLGGRVIDAVLDAGFHRTPAPAPDVQALIDEARAFIGGHYRADYPTTFSLLDRLADALEASAVSTPQVTDEMVESGGRALYENRVADIDSDYERAQWPSWVGLNAGDANEWRTAARVALEAALGVSTPQDTEWEYDAGYEADNGIEMRWFSMGAGAFTIREAAEREVERFADPQIRLVRRTRPGPWEPVPTEGVSE